VSTIYGIPAVDVLNPDGETVPYPYKPVAALPGEWAAWLVTNPGGKVYRVSESPGGLWRCTCPHWHHRQRDAWREADFAAFADKHIAAVRVALAQNEGVDGRQPDGGTGPAR